MCKIESYEKYSNEIGKMNHIYVFRGQANKEWDLKPSAFRIDDSSDDDENVLKFVMDHSKSFKLSLFSMIELARHYGANTRVLDFTHNPDVALFFACYGEKDKDGIVYIIDKTEYEKNIPLKIHNFNYDLQKNIFDIYYDNVENDVYGDDNYTWNRPVFIEPEIKFDRIRNQEGLMLLFANDQEFKDEYVYKKIVIPASKKESILEELKRNGINEDIIFMKEEFINDLLGVGKNAKKNN